MTPSSPSSPAASSSASPSSKTPESWTDRIRREQLLEPGPPLCQRQVDDRLAVGLQQVEHLVREPGASLLHRGEARLPVRIEGHDLAVEDRVGRAQRLHELLRHRRKPLREVVASAREQLRLAAADVRERAVTVPFRLELPVAARQLLGQRREHRPIHARPGRHPVLSLAEEEPVLLVAGEVCRHERPRSLEPLAVQPHGEAAVPLLLEELVRAAVPDLDGARPVVPLRDLTLEAPVLEWMVLDMDGEVLLARLERDALRHRPRGENAVPLEAEVVVEPPGVVPLHDEDRLLCLTAPTAKRLGGLLPVSLALVLRELLAHEAFSESRVVFLPFTQPIHGGDKPVDGVDSVRLGNARTYANLP